MITSLRFVLFIMAGMMFFNPVLSQNNTFTNPILPSGPDPYSTYYEGHYYYTHTVGDRLILWKTDNLANLGSAERRTIWIPPTGKMFSKHI